MTTPKNQVWLPPDLRQRAEELVRTTNEDLSAMSLEGVHRVVQELQVHQIELEMQNEELRKTQLELEVSRDEYFDLYNFSPVGYLTLDPSGIILNASLATTTLLGVERSCLIHTKLASFIAQTDMGPFILHLEQVFADDSQHTCELPIRKDGGAIFYARVESIATCDADGNKNQCRTALIDITERKQADKDLRQAFEQLRELTRELKGKEEKERTQFARELHDEFGQSLTALMLDLGWVDRRVNTLPSSSSLASIHTKIMGMKSLVDQTAEGVRRMAASLRPRVLDDLGLIAALEWQAQECQNHSGIQCGFSVDSQLAGREFSEAQSTTMFRIAQELTTNVMRHAQASDMWMSLRQEGTCLVLSVKDNGIGIPQSLLDDPKSFGILGMRERASLLGGACTFVGKLGEGTTARIRLPLAHFPEVF